MRPELMHNGPTAELYLEECSHCAWK